MDEETGPYYYGARYLDPKYSRWLSGDPVLGDYIPKAPIDDEAKKHNENLPGMGGIYNTVNLHLYHYAGIGQRSDSELQANNPVKYTDPDGRETTVMIIHANTGWEKFVSGSHVAVHFSNPGVDKYNYQIGQTLYDPSGSYQAKDEFGCLYRSSSGVFSGESSGDLKAYIDSVLDRQNGEYIVAYTINTTPEQEKAMVESAMELGDGDGFSCASHTSEVLEKLDFKEVMTPGGLEKQLKNSKVVENIKVFSKDGTSIIYSKPKKYCRVNIE
ncbi:hypothetical protein JO41_06680 [Treponema sp. OMZ 838]|nr:hypothetical protein [Treponema sp. OMZ 838]AIW89518.1 hypothetical protein JO41_06680 [Treponema sp. OMZ 838]